MYSRARSVAVEREALGPEAVGVNVPVQRADQTPGRPAGGVLTSTVGSTRVITGAPLRSGDAKYSAVSPWPAPDAGVSVGVDHRRLRRAGRSLRVGDVDVLARARPDALQRRDGVRRDDVADPPPV